MRKMQAGRLRHNQINHYDVDTRKEMCEDAFLSQIIEKINKLEDV
jgi:hypothetical protein